MNRLEKPEEVVRVAVGLMKRGEQYLVGRRPPGVPLAGYDEFPGGKCRQGESPEACLARECLEETGLQIAVLGLRREVRHAYPNGLLHLYFLDCRPADADAIPRPPFRWVDRADLAALRFPEANEPVLRDLLKESAAACRDFGLPDA